MNTRPLLHLPMTKPRYLKGGNYLLSIYETGSNVYVSVFIKKKGVVYVSMPAPSTVRKQVVRTTMLCSLVSEGVILDARAVTGVETANA